MFLYKYFSILLLLSFASTGQSTKHLLLPESSSAEKIPGEDWLLKPVTVKAQIIPANNKRDLILNNGLVQRTFRLSPDLACIDYKNLINGQQLLRAVKPEARITIDGKDYSVGGLSGQKENAYLKTRPVR